MSSGDAQQIALRHTGELVKEAAERDNGRLSVKEPRPNKINKYINLRVDMLPIQRAVAVYVVIL